MLKLNFAGLAILSACMVNAANAAEHTNTAYGTVVTDSSVGRDIALSPAAKYINVTNGETVAISADGKTFSWHVNTVRDGGVIELAKVAPHGVTVPNVNVYVAADPASF